MQATFVIFSFLRWAKCAKITQILSIIFLMNKRHPPLMTVFLLGLLALPLSACLANNEQNQAMPVENLRVIDGDTVEIIVAGESQRVRLLGIDAPEKGQAFGKKSTQSLKNCTKDKSLSVFGEKTDRYGRLVGIIFADGVDCNLSQIEQGMAWHYKSYQKDQSTKNQRLYANAEQAAQSDKVGLWADKCQIAPWDWRKGQKSC